jgi:hypothetical protein
MFFGGKKNTLYGSTKRNGHRSRRALLLGRPGQKSGDFDYKLMVTEQPKVDIEKFIRCRVSETLLFLSFHPGNT